jgi:hypothetical protein
MLSDITSAAQGHLPSNLCWLISSGFRRTFFGRVIALRAFKGPQIRTGTTGFDPGQHHAASVTLRAAGSFGHSQS